MHDARPETKATSWAANHHGLISLDEARRCGLTDEQVRHLVRVGRWERLTRTVFRVAGAPETWQQRALAACLAGPAATVLSHLSAAAVHGLSSPSPLPHITVPPTASARNRLARTHRSSIQPVDRAVIGGLPVTAPARTLVDCAQLIRDRGALARLVDDALHRGLADRASVEAAMARAQRGPGRAGAAALTDVLAVWSDAIEPGSPAEVRLFRMLREWGFETPTSQVELRDQHGRFVARLDAGWPRRQVGIEYDGERFHGPRELAADEARHARIADLGWRLVRVDRHDLRPSATRLRDELRRLFTGTAQACA